jgi:ATP-dependent helicase/nuclease subunit A
MKQGELWPGPAGEAAGATLNAGAPLSAGAPPRLPEDQAQREAIRHDLDVTMMVEAAAGTGKTTNLVSRMVNLVRHGRSSVATIAAITFTVKAAANLRETFQEGLEKAVRETNDATEAERLREALDGIDRGFIGTTHAFCARLLRERPVEAGLDPDFEELGEAEARQLTPDFWSRWYESQALAGNPLIEEAREVGLDRWILRSGFEKVVEYPDIVMVSTRTARPNLRGACDELLRFLDECEPHLPTAAHRAEPDEFEQLIVNLLRRRDAADLAEVGGQLELLKEANHASRKPVQKRWPDKATAKQLGERYKAFVTGTVRPILQSWTEHVHGVAIELVSAAAKAFEAERRRNGTLTYQDLLTCARDMLRDDANVRRYLQRRFTHVLVDEFQDTDPLQAEILFYLTGENVDERNWRKLAPRAGSLFIVGDPKQSIYRFRRADITTYLGVKERIEAAGGVIVPLSTNFRSAQSICTFVNDAFGTMFAGDEVSAGRQAKHVDLSPFRITLEDAFTSSPTVNGVFALETQKADKDSMAGAEARCVAQWIRRAVDGGMKVAAEEGAEKGERSVRWSDILLIGYHPSRLSFYAAALEELHIPYEITGSKAFKESDALEMAMPLLRAVADPDDVVSLVGFLRGPLCGVDDEALYRFVRDGGAFSPFRETPPQSDERVARGLEIVREAINDAEKHPPAAALGRLFDRIGLTALAATSDHGGTQSGNLLLALTIAREDSAKGQSLSAIVDHFAALLKSPPDIGVLDVDPRRSDAVRLMNLHQVKGLEAPVVFLIDPSEPFEFPIDLFVDRSSEESRGYLAVTRKRQYDFEEIGLPTGWGAMKQAEQAFKEAEKKRLLYVAATRAKDMLVVGFHRTVKGVEGAWGKLAERIPGPLFEQKETATESPINAPAAVQFDDAVAGIDARFTHARASSYSVLPITKIAHGSHAELVRAEEGLGKGTSWGRVLHRLFEAMLRVETLDIRLYAGNLLKDEERDAADLEEVMKVVEAVQSSSLWKRVKTADERYVEVPFALNAPRRQVGIDEDGDTLLHGTIDLAFRENDQWFIVDYKSDSTAGRLNSLVDYYAAQVRHYSRFWSQLTGMPTTGGLFFVDGCIERWVDDVPEG